MQYLLFIIFVMWIIIAAGKIGTAIDDNYGEFPIESVWISFLWPIRLLFRFMDKIKEILHNMGM